MMWSVVQFIAKLSDDINRVVAKVVSWAIYPLIAIVVIETIARYAFAVPIIWARDVSLWLYAFPFMLTAAYYYGNNKHIAAEDLLYATRMSPRGRAIVDVVHYLVFLLPIAILLLEPAVMRVQHSIQWGEVSTITIWRPPLWPVRAVIPITLVMLILQGISGLGHALRVIIKGK
ncbi:TRAP transporter small permease subunit [Dehalococcoidia bacterium]|nr:TRAP transporter small permease subunit [Dehalococcoidia bacterium]